MSNIHSAFDHGKAFIGFVTGGDPTFELSLEFIVRMAEAGADLVEIGIPFSDPIAEGPVIQNANLRALRAGATVDSMFDLARAARSRTDVPLVFLTYLNPVFHRGYDRFFRECADVGVDGIIMPDLPFEEQGEARDIAAAHGVDVITMIAPTSRERIQLLAPQARGFVYTVSSMGVTGMRSELHRELPEALAEIKCNTQIPVAVGFGISTPQQASAVAAMADGVIVGSAIVKLVEEFGANAGAHISRYVREMKDAVLLKTIQN